MSTSSMEVQDTMDRPNDPGGASSTAPPIIIIPDIPGNAFGAAWAGYAKPEAAAAGYAKPEAAVRR
eukprot:8175136-Heterocapsa_arctica.AAC.1